MRLLFIIALTILLSSLFSAEIRDGQLFLEVYIADGKQIELSTRGSFSISEIGSPLSGSYSGDVQLSIITSDEQIMWGLINQTEDVTHEERFMNPEDNIMDKFAWRDGKLTIIHERLVFEDKYFTSQSAAEKYADETGYPRKMIHPIPMQSAGLKVINGSKKADYYQLPISIVCDSTIVFNQQKNDYSGIFLIKPSGGELVVTNLQDLESYVMGVVPNEIGSTAPEEALKLQSVAARTHAISLLLANKHLNDGYDLCNGTHCQVYKGNHLVSNNVRAAIMETHGIVMLYEDRIADAVYHSNCGGKTESNQNAWFGKPIAFLQGVACNPDTDCLDLTDESEAVQWINQTSDTDGMASWEKRSERWEQTISRSRLAQNAGVTNLHTMTVLSRGVSGRILKLKLIGSNQVTLQGEYKIRQAFGSLPSSLFYIRNGSKSSDASYALPETVTIKGKGFGHGVGLCQVGALQKVRAGWNWQDILSFYYPGTELSSDWLCDTAFNLQNNGTE
jgi:SpoIID/LytB domain protein